MCIREKSLDKLIFEVFLKGNKGISIDDCHYYEMKESDHIEQVDEELLASYLSGEASDEEKSEVERWTGRSAENREVFQSCSDIMQKSRLYYQTRRFEATKAWERVDRDINRNSSREGVKINLFRRKMLRVAAIGLLALALGSAGFYVGWRQQKTAIFTEVISGEKQVLQEVTLPDGSVVSLNSSSRIHFPKQFSGKQRKVSIEGEAFFKVKPDPQKPFVISAGTAQIRVLGTSFNVCARPGESTVEVTVETGKVQFGCNRLAQKPCDQLILTPGEKGVFFTADQALKKAVNDNPNVNAWLTHDLVFNKTRLQEVTEILRNVYHTDIQLSDPELGELILTAHFNDQPIDFILDVIRLTFSLELSAQNGQYFLTAAKNNP